MLCSRGARCILKDHERFRGLGSLGTVRFCEVVELLEGLTLFGKFEREEMANATWRAATLVSSMLLNAG
jgi:hypothetical protein